jgi:hypothetical protein
MTPEPGGHLRIALATAAAESGYRVTYTLATELVNEFAEAADDDRQPRGPAMRRPTGLNGTRRRIDVDAPGESD